MTHSRIEAARLGGRLFKSSITTAFALSALAGGVMLSGGEAQAACNTPPLSPQSVNLLPDPSFVGSKTDTLVSTYTGPGTCVVGLSNLVSPANQTFVRLDYSPGLTGTDTFGYTYSSNRPDVRFDQVSLSLTDANGGDVETVTKNIYSDSTKTTLLASLTTTNITKTAPIPGNYSSIYVEDIMNGNGASGGSITAVTNGFRQTPGPLPILGAGAAFGFSRKLRGRIKAARTA